MQDRVQLRCNWLATLCSLGGQLHLTLHALNNVIIALGFQLQPHLRSNNYLVQCVRTVSTLLPLRTPNELMASVHEFIKTQRWLKNMMLLEEGCHWPYREMRFVAEVTFTVLTIMLPINVYCMASQTKEKKRWKRSNKMICGQSIIWNQ